MAIERTPAPPHPTHWYFSGDHQELPVRRTLQWVRSNWGRTTLPPQGVLLGEGGRALAHTEALGERDGEVARVDDRLRNDGWAPRDYEKRYGRGLYHAVP